MLGRVEHQNSFITFGPVLSHHFMGINLYLVKFMLLAEECNQLPQRVEPRAYLESNALQLGHHSPYM